MGLILGLTLGSFFLIILLGTLYKLDLYRTSQFRLVTYALIWGIFAYGLVSIVIHLIKNLGAPNEKAIVVYFVPFLEEIIKGLILFIMVRRSQLTYSFDGALYGFAVGIGFAIAENIGYISNNPSEALFIASQRMLSANLVHASSSAIVGIALGMVFLRRHPLRWLALVVGFALATGQHILYNKISLDGNALPSAVLIGIAGIVFVYIAIHLGKKQAQNWIKQQLGMEAFVTHSEVVAVERLDNPEHILFPVLERFGAEKASQVERLLYLQARLGLRRRALDNFRNNATLRNKLEAEIRELRTEIKAAYRAIGVYTMLFVRGLYTAEMVSVWERMQAKIQERSAQNNGQKGGGLWSSLEERIKTPVNVERHD